MMHKLILIMIICSLLLSCSENKKINFEETTNKLKIEESNPYFSVVVDSQNPELTDFEVKTNNSTFAEIINKLNNSNFHSLIKRDFCWGDCCGASKKIVDQKNNQTLYLFKFDCGDHGYGNKQFYFKDDSLSTYRSFEYNIEEYPETDTSIVKWKAQEIIIEFKSNNAILQERSKISAGNDYTINELPFETKTVNKAQLLKEKIEDFENSINLENSKD